jgi:hypothetical protein
VYVPKSANARRIAITNIAHGSFLAVQAHGTGRVRYYNPHHRFTLTLLLALMQFCNVCLLRSRTVEDAIL